MPLSRSSAPTDARTKKMQTKKKLREVAMYPSWRCLKILIRKLECEARRLKTSFIGSNFL